MREERLSQDTYLSVQNSRRSRMQRSGCIRLQIASLMIIIAIIGVTGCGGKFTVEKGDKVSRKNFLIPIKDGKQQGEWKTNELSIAYEYEIASKTMGIAGTVQLLGGFSIGFQWITGLQAHLLLLDEQGFVMEIIPVYSSGLRRTSDSRAMVFESKIPIPESVRTFSFAYEGELKGAGALDSSTFSIQFSPVKK
jgi:hypothetical protein